MAPNDRAHSSIQTFRAWQALVNRRLIDVYGISVVDAGIDDDYLKIHWEANELPNDFVSWFGEKYDLNRKDEFSW